jgi:hypothetical protein
MSEDNVAQRQQHEDLARYGLHYSQIAIGYLVAFQQHDAVKTSVLPKIWVFTAKASGKVAFLGVQIRYFVYLYLFVGQYL